MSERTVVLTVRGIVDDDHLNRIVDLVNTEAYVSDIRVLSADEDSCKPLDRTLAHDI